MENDNLKKWIEGTLTEEEKREFESSDEFRAIDRLLKSTLSFKAPDYDHEEEFSRLSKRLRGRVVSMSWAGTWLRAAAGIAFLVVCSYFIYNYNTASTIILETRSGIKNDLVLPDSSFVRLNALSRLSYSSTMKDRKVNLNGEAYFRVQQGSRFEVQTSAGTVSVLGTEFNVKTRDNFFEVICYEGSVRVESGEQSITLHPHDAFRLLSDGPGIELKTSDPVPSWIHNESSFQKVPFRFVVQELQVQYNVAVDIQDVDINELFTGAFPHNDLQLALQSISRPMNLKFQIESKHNILLHR